MNRKDALIELVFLGQAEMLRFADGLDEIERSSSGTVEHWAPRDELAHMTIWKGRLAQNLAASQLGQPVQVNADIHAENAATFENYRQSTWDQIMELVETAQTMMLAQLESLSETDLADPARFPWLDGRPAWRSVAGNCYLHPLSHLGPAYVQRGQPEHVTLMWKSGLDLLNLLDDAPEWQGIIAYDVACSLALTGHPAQALEKLGVALRLSPGLAGWAQQDTDLASLWDAPEFKALVA